MGVFLNLRRIPSYCQGHFHFCEIADCIVITYRHLVHHKTKSRSKTHVLDLLLAYRNLQFLPRYKINPNLSPIGNKFGSPCFGGDEEDRTLDLTDANRTLSQLSYGPKQHIDYKPMLSKSQLLFFDFSEKWVKSNARKQKTFVTKQKSKRDFTLSEIR